MKYRRTKPQRAWAGIRRESLINHITLALLVILLTSVLSYVLTYCFLREDKQEQLLKQATNIAEAAFLNGETMFDGENAALFAELADAHLFVADMQGDVLRLRR